MKGRWRKDKRSDPTGSAVVTLSSPPASPPVQKSVLSTSSSSPSTVSSLSSPFPQDSSAPQENTQVTKTPGTISCEKHAGAHLHLSHKPQPEETNVVIQKKDKNRSLRKGYSATQSNPSSSSSPEYLQDTTSFFSRQRMAQLAKQQPTSEGAARNAGALYACQSLKKSSEFALCDTETHAAFKKALDGGSIYLPEFCCKRDDMTLFDRLFQDLLQYASQLEARAKETSSGDDNPKKQALEEEVDLSSSSSSSTSPQTSSSLSSFPSSSSSSSLPFLGAVNWSRHLKHENPSFSSTFCKIIEQLSAYFDVEVYATRLNLYMDHTHWKPLHKDSHAYSSVTNQTEDITVGASFGASRELEFVHDQNQEFRFVFPQHNGDVFAFNSEINQLFKHGVPKGGGNTGGEGLSSSVSRGREDSTYKTDRENTARFSIILWGRRKKLTERNASRSELARQSRYEDRNYR